MSRKKEGLTGRKPGGQPGNKNAFRHGLYAQRITLGEVQVLDTMKVTDIEGEIAYMRVVCGRIANILENNGLESNATEELNDDTLRTLGALDKTLTTLLTYVRQYSLQTGEMSDLEADIEEGKELARKELGVYDYLDPSKGD